MLEPFRCQIVGAGLMGGSIGLGLRGQGWIVSGTDRETVRAERGLELGCFDAVGTDPSAGLTFICTPASSVAGAAHAALALGGIVTDIAGVKGAVVAAVDNPRFVGGHPMAGSEQDGIDGASATMFQGRRWVLTPTDTTDATAFATVHGVVAALGAEVISVAPARHDELVAVVSHVPHLTAATLMRVAADGADEDAALLQLAAGGFRDMTRIAAGHPAIWLDICAENRSAIVVVLDRLLAELACVRMLIDTGDRGALEKVLMRSRVARINLPVGAPPPDSLVEFRIPIPDRPGFIAEISTLASDLAVNIYDIEISHSIEGDGGVLVLVVSAAVGELFRGGLLARRFKTSYVPLEQP